MRTTAQFFREISHLHDPDGLAVLFSEKRHRARLLRFLYSHNLCLDCQILRNLLIDNLFDFTDFLRRHRRRMREIKTRSLSVLIGTCLFHMIAEHLPERFLQ